MGVGPDDQIGPVSDGESRTGESAKERADRSFAELLQGFRVAVTGVQVLFAFLLIVPFSVSFPRVDTVGRWLFFSSMITAAFASIFFIAPAAQHRVLFRTGNKELLLRRSNRLGIWGAVALAVSMTCAATLVVQTFFSSWLAVPTAAVVALACGWLWFLQPLRSARNPTPNSG